MAWLPVTAWCRFCWWRRTEEFFIEYVRENPPTVMNEELGRFNRAATSYFKRKHRAVTTCKRGRELRIERVEQDSIGKMPR
jgi:hypothetical protein